MMVKEKKKSKKTDIKKYADYLIKGIYAGIMIAIGGTVYLSVKDTVVGSFLFSIGLLMICIYGMNLYTGKIGYILVNKIEYVYELLLSLLGNLLGTLLVGKLILLTRFSSIHNRAVEMSALKLNDSLLSIFILAIFCGMLMYIAVNNFKKSTTEIGKYSGIFMCLMVFILCGFEHCVANMYYFSVANVWSFRTLLYVLVMVLGNSAGSILIALFDNLYHKN